MRKKMIAFAGMLLALQPASFACAEDMSIDMSQISSMSDAFNDMSSSASSASIPDMSGLDTSVLDTSLDMSSFNEASANNKLDMDSLSSSMSSSADAYFSQTMGSSYTGLDSSLYAVTVPDISFEDLNTDFANLQMSFNDNKKELNTEMNMPTFNNYSGNARNAFNGTFGDLADSLTISSYKIPESFDPTSLLKQIESMKQGAYSSFQGSKAFSTVKGKLSIGEVFAKADKGLSMPDIDLSKVSGAYKTAQNASSKYLSGYEKANNAAYSRAESSANSKKNEINNGKKSGIESLGGTIKDSATSISDGVKNFFSRK